MFKVFGFYKFIKIKSLKRNKYLLQKFLTSNNIRGTIIIAKEGLNGTISGHINDIDKTIKKLKSLFLFKHFITMSIKSIGDIPALIDHSTTSSQVTLFLLILNSSSFYIHLNLLFYRSSTYLGNDLISVES